MLGTTAVDLLREFQAQSDAGLPAYREDVLQAVAAEVWQLYQRITALLSQGVALNDPTYAAPLLVYHESIQRNKRCALAYLNARAEHIRALRWQAGSVLPDDVLANFGPQEERFFRQYDRLLGDYMAAIDLDLTADPEPPKDLFVEILALQDCGDIVTDNGVVSLRKNTTHFVRRDRKSVV